MRPELRVNAKTILSPGPQLPPQQALSTDGDGAHPIESHLLEQPIGYEAHPVAVR